MQTLPSAPPPPAISPATNPPSDTPEPLPGDQRPRESYRLKMRGMKPAAIAKVFGVVERTEFRWIAAHVEEFRESFES